MYHLLHQNVGVVCQKTRKIQRAITGIAIRQNTPYHKDPTNAKHRERSCVTPRFLPNTPISVDRFGNTLPFNLLTDWNELRYQILQSGLILYRMCVLAMVMEK